VDLSDVMKTVIKSLDSSPSAIPPLVTTATAPKPKDKAETFYDEVCAYVGRSRGDERKPPIEDGCLRASALSKVLAATFKLGELRTRAEFDIAFTEKPVAAELMTYDLGHAIHQLWRDNYLGPMRRLWGTWRCVRCDWDRDGVMPWTCAGCGQTRFEFEETLYIDRELRIRGHSDGLLAGSDPHAPPKAILEIKSASSDSWDKLTAPDGDHLDQTHVYMHGSGLREVMFIYVDKGKQTKWKWSDGRLRPTGLPRVKVYHAEFDDKRWAGIKEKLVDFWAIYDALAVA